MFKNLIVLLNVSVFFLGSQAVAERFQTEDQFSKNLALQVELTPQTLSVLYKYGVTLDTELRLEYFFYTNSEVKASSLHRALTELGYSGSFGRVPDENSLFLITGWSEPVRMSEEAAVSWTQSMSRLAFEHDAVFDGWGTNPEQ